MEAFANTLHDKLHALEQYLHKEGDQVAAEQVGELRAKEEIQELTIGFCGHFSAGKSSLINELCAAQVLPSSPLPTSANAVFLRNGERRVVLTSTGEHQEPTAVEISPDELEDYCKNGQDFSRIEVWDDIPLLHNGGVFLDTPGVDSNDAGHALATESALHLADVVFYVMDYNHVQSETNLTFAKSLSDWGKPLYLVVNQIDKHREQEISFTDYQHSVEQAFEVWQVKPAGIIYLSLKQADHPRNELPELKRVLGQLLERSSVLLEYSLNCSAEHAGIVHVQQFEQGLQEEKEDLLVQIGGEDAAVQWEEDIAALEREATENDSLPDRLQTDFAKELDKLLGSAQLMTPPLREAAAQYLESRSPNFKMGFLFAGGKTEAEKKRREQELYAKLIEQVEAQVDWHVRDLLRKLGQSQDVWSSAWETKIGEALPQPELSWISAPVKAGATVSGETTLHYASDVKAGIVLVYRRAAVALAAALLGELAPQQESVRRELAKRRSALQARAELVARLRGLARDIASRAETMRALLGAPATLTPGVLPEVRALAAAPAPAAASLAPQAPVAREAVHAPAAEAAAPIRRRLDQAAAVLEAAAAELAPYPPFEAGRQGLTARADTLRRGKFTIALFGAFSAGKSSFANALLGQRVLPVSPHPTTAAINRIMAPEGEYNHGTAVVSLKTAAAMEEDLAYSFSVLQLGEFKVHTWLDTISKVKVQDIPSSGRSHYSFLKAAAMGWTSESPRLGSSIVTGLDEFSSYVAQENLACFVAGIDLYYSCPWTEQGIVLVDTPGADSIHARHTGVTFQYMKNSDALLYVTYYNHAFSRADRQFLAQLGRVKGNFALDKMFFLVNAADLAASEEELHQVIDHVGSSLRTAGIHQPQIFGVSSLHALEAKLSGEASEAGFASFEKTFSTFIGSDLSALAIGSAAEEVHQIGLRIEQRISSLSQSGQERAALQQRIPEEKIRIQQAFAQLRDKDLGLEMSQETEELLFHVRQRLRLTGNELFREFFHPSLLQDSGGDLKRRFAVSVHDWTAQMSGELERELQATSFRLEKKSSSLLERELQLWIEKQRGYNFGPQLYAPQPLGWDTPEIGEGLLSHALPWKEYWGYFKNPKFFFEGPGKEQLREALEGPMENLIREAVEAIAERFVNYYREGTAHRLRVVIKSFEQQWSEWANEQLEVTSASELDAMRDLVNTMKTHEAEVQNLALHD
ncbi:GTPase Era involved in 16S rRNA processing [Paenibacillus shirakamiensis]|uniref:GTPase Era involved in 16S rRNA processing n=1 Tax=Paenibacillus shirakamiensis TaxID=1265935 RepID=A0ABS4JD23_9BACL|nr:dynamin family protein [Paenibacillus shirakamiensis]MBP1999612.1 GTPase Era involved in 16S rRNA processing [Paenibacillus shirakamiensis]